MVAGSELAAGIPARPIFQSWPTATSTRTSYMLAVSRRVYEVRSPFVQYGVCTP